jgi:hypothetical protein
MGLIVNEAWDQVNRLGGGDLYEKEGRPESSGFS